MKLKSQRLSIPMLKVWSSGDDDDDDCIKSSAEPKSRWQKEQEKKFYTC